MTGRPSFDAQLLDWLEAGPARAPLQIMETVSAAIPSIPQRRARRVQWRFHSMPGLFKLAVGVATIMVALAGGLILGSFPSPSLLTVSPVPTAGTTPAAEPEPVGSNPSGTWHASRNGVYGMNGGHYELDVAADSPLIARGPDGREVLLGSARDAPAGQVAFGPTDRCPGSGTYAYVMSDDFVRLTVDAVSDDCVDRRTLLAGAWDRSSISYALTPRRPYQVELDPTVAFSIPQGFANPTGEPPGVFVGLGDVGASHQPAPSMWVEAGDFFAQILIREDVPLDRCDLDLGSVAPSATIEDFIAWNRATTGATVSEPMPTTIGGHRAVAIDVTGTSECANVHEPDCGCMPAGFMSPGLEERIWAVDLGGRIAMVVFHDDSGATPVPLTPERLAIAQELVDAIEFR